MATGLAVAAGLLLARRTHFFAAGSHLQPSLMIGVAVAATVAGFAAAVFTGTLCAWAVTPAQSDTNTPTAAMPVTVRVSRNLVRPREEALVIVPTVIATHCRR